MDRSEHVLIIIAAVIGGLLLLVGIVRFCTTNPDLRMDSDPTDVTNGFFDNNWFGRLLSFVFRSLFGRWWF